MESEFTRQQRQVIGSALLELYQRSVVAGQQPSGELVQAVVEKHSAAAVDIMRRKPSITFERLADHLWGDT